MTREHAYKLRDLIHTAVISLDDASALDGIELFPLWKSNTAYAIGDRRRYGDKLYKCVQAHTSQDDWTPDKVPALFIEVSIEEFPEWKQPTGSHDAYAKGDKVSHLGKRWVSTIDSNVYEPSVYGWDEIT